MISLGNTNSLIDQIYYYLWYKDDSIKEGIYKIRIPDTIVFKYGQPQLWYFTTTKGDILIKKEESRSQANIIKTFCKDGGDGNVVASFIYPHKYNYYANTHTQDYVMQNEKKKQLLNLDVDEKICIFYMTKEILISFLNDASKPPEGILQKFIEPYGEKETLIQAAWSPSVCILSRQQNYRSLNDKRYDPYERCVTFDGAEVFSRAVPIRGKEISQSVRNQVKMVVDKITNISYEKINISRLVMYFKSDKNNVMWFLYASCLRTQDEDKEQVALYRTEHLQWKNNPCKKQNNTPIALANNYAKPHNVKLQQTTNTIHPTTLIKDILCFDCNQLCQQKGCLIYEQLTQNDRFLAKTIYLCEDCLLNYSKTNCEITGAIPKGKMNLKFFRRSLASKTNIMQNQDLKTVISQMNNELTKERKILSYRANNSAVSTDWNTRSINKRQSQLANQTMVPLLEIGADPQKEEIHTQKSTYNQSCLSNGTTKHPTNLTDKESIIVYSYRGQRPRTSKPQVQTKSVHTLQNNKKSMPDTLESRFDEHQKSSYLYSTEIGSSKKNVGFLDHYFKISRQNEPFPHDSKEIQNDWYEAKYTTDKLNSIP